MDVVYLICFSVLHDPSRDPRYLLQEEGLRAMKANAELEIPWTLRRVVSLDVMDTLRIMGLDRLTESVQTRLL